MLSISSEEPNKGEGTHRSVKKVTVFLQLHAYQHHLLKQTVPGGEQFAFLASTTGFTEEAGRTIFM